MTLGAIFQYVELIRICLLGAVLLKLFTPEGVYAFQILCRIWRLADARVMGHGAWWPAAKGEFAPAVNEIRKPCSRVMSWSRADGVSSKFFDLSVIRCNGARLFGVREPTDTIGVEFHFEIRTTNGLRCPAERQSFVEIMKLGQLENKL